MVPEPSQVAPSGYGSPGLMGFGHEGQATGHRSSASKPVAAPEAAARPLGAVTAWLSFGAVRRPQGRLRAGSPRVAVIAHGLTLLSAFALWAYLDRNLWFFGDEWDFLTRRGLHGAYFSLWTPHNEHWSVLPILLWRGIYSLEHLSSYWPYLIPLLLAHVVVVHLLWRRCLVEGTDAGWPRRWLCCSLAWQPAPKT